MTSHPRLRAVKSEITCSPHYPRLGITLLIFDLREVPRSLSSFALHRNRNI